MTPPPPQAGPPSGARTFHVAALLLLTAINLINYLDRYVLSAVLPWIEADFGLTDRQSGLLGSMFMVAYLLASPVSGYLGDRMVRRNLIAGGVFLWSLATIGSGLAQSYESLLWTRALIGIGEAGYAVVAPGLIADLYRERYRGRMLAYFYMAIPVGSALGYMIGGVVGEAYGWRPAFYVAGAPGLIMAVVALWLPEPERGAIDNEFPSGPRLTARATLVRLFRTPVWRIDTIGITLTTFSVGGLAFWMPTFLVRTQGMSIDSAGWTLGWILVAAGLLGALLGGFLGDRAQARGQGGHFLVCAVALLVCAPVVAAMPFVPTRFLVLGFGFVALFLLGVTVGPINAALVSCVPANLRSAAVAMNNLVVHLFGDALSPFLLGWISDAASLRVAVSLTAVPVMLAALLLLSAGLRINHWPEGLRRYPG
jgi:MFS family permease